MDASWSTSATRFGSTPSGPNTSASSRWCADAGGVPSQGSAASAFQSRPSTCGPQPDGASTR